MGFDNSFPNNTYIGLNKVYITSPTVSINENQLTHPGETLEIGETGLPWQSVWGGSVTWQGYGYDSHWVYRHNGGADLLFCDGHVKWYSQSVLDNSQSTLLSFTPTSNDNSKWYGWNGSQYDWPFATNPSVSY
ncbi:MAG: hypothetical protein M1501_02480 [Candidatus Omnitrophica bacterium]|nr:hypothetical protein [Candidatus Omnitrophota bacterium]